MSRRTACARALFSLALVLACSPTAARPSGRNHQREVAVWSAESASFTAWKRFDFVPSSPSPNGPPARTTPLVEREQQALLRLIIAQAFAQRGYQHETIGPVDFVIETAFDHPGDPPLGAKTWIFGKKTNWLEIRLRAPDDRAVLWTGRAFHVFRKKRGGNADEDQALRFLAAAQAIARTFPRAACDASPETLPNDRFSAADDHTLSKE